MQLSDLKILSFTVTGTEQNFGDKLVNDMIRSIYYVKYNNTGVTSDTLTLMHSVADGTSGVRIDKTRLGGEQVFSDVGDFPGSPLLVISSGNSYIRAVSSGNTWEVTLLYADSYE